MKNTYAQNRSLVERILLRRFYDPGDVLAKLQQDKGTLRTGRGFDGVPRLQSESITKPTPFVIKASASIWTPRKFDRPVYVWCNGVARTIRCYPGDSMPEIGADMISRGMFFSSVTGFFRIPTDGAYLLNTPVLSTDTEGLGIEFLYADSLADVGIDASGVIGSAASVPPVTDPDLAWTTYAQLTIAAADTAVLAALLARKAASFFNASTGGQSIALTTQNPATASNRGFIFLPPNVGVIIHKREGMPTGIIRGFASAAGALLNVAEAI